MFSQEILDNARVSPYLSQPGLSKCFGVRHEQRRCDEKTDPAVRRLGHRKVEINVTLGFLSTRPDVCLDFVHNSSETEDFFLSRVFGCQLSIANFEFLPHLQHVQQQRIVALEQLLEHARRKSRRVLTYVGPVSVADLEQAKGLKDVDRLPHRGATHLEGCGQISFRRNPGPGRYFPR
jgi:hypothetical protein